MQAAEGTIPAAAERVAGQGADWGIRAAAAARTDHRHRTAGCHHDAVDRDYQATAATSLIPPTLSIRTGYCPPTRGPPVRSTGTTPFADLLGQGGSAHQRGEPMRARYPRIGRSRGSCAHRPGLVAAATRTAAAETGGPDNLSGGAAFPKPSVSEGVWGFWKSG